MEKNLKRINRDLLKKKKTNNFSIKESIKNLRWLQENKGSIRLTQYDQSEEEEKFKRYIDRKDVVINFIDLEIYENLVIWGGTIDDVFKFFYRVTPDSRTSTFDFTFLDGFDPTGETVELESEDEYVEKQMDLFEKVKNYYDQFADYWRNELNMG